MEARKVWGSIVNLVAEIASKVAACESAEHAPQVIRTARARDATFNSDCDAGMAAPTCCVTPGRAQANLQGVRGEAQSQGGAVVAPAQIPLCNAQRLILSAGHAGTAGYAGPSHWY
eukprot:228322-Rhodomonas_salina.2